MTQLLKEGPAQFTILWIENYTSKAGNKSIKLKLELEQGDLRGLCYEYLSPKSPKRIEAFLGALEHNPLENAFTDTTDGDLMRLKGLNGHVKVRIEKSENPDYSDKNRVAFWEPNKRAAAMKKALTAQEKIGKVLSRPLHSTPEPSPPLASEEDSFWADVPPPDDIDIPF